jgi:ferredoxin
MMNTVFCFSSTGNSLYAAKKIAERIGGRVLPMRGVGATASAPAVCGDVIGFVFPAYFWGLPRMVKRFIKGLQIENEDAYIFAVVTYGGGTPGLLGVTRNLLKQKGVALTYGAYLKMVDNYIAMYKPKDSEALRKKIDNELGKITDAIVRKERRRIPPATILNRIMYKYLPGEDSDQFFSVSDECTGCTICQSVCPAENIALVSSRPEFRHKCENCMGCLQNCPVHAIEWKEKTVGKERFRNANVTLDELISLQSKR